MANADQPQGLRPYGSVKQTSKQTAGATIYPGDAVKLSADGKCDPVAAGNAIFGVALNYAVDEGALLVSVDPEQPYVVQGDDTELSAQGVVGNNADILATAGNATYKISRMELDSSTVGSASAQLTILGLLPEVGNAWGAQADVVVKINEHQMFGKDSDAGV